MNHISINTRSSIKLTGSKTIYFDPLELTEAPHDADLIFVTHEHYDHFSPEDLVKVMNPKSQLIVPNSMLELAQSKGFEVKAIHGIDPGEKVDYGGVICHAIPSYNIGKQFHPKANNWVGYLVEFDGQTYYAMGDTDVTEEAAKVDADVIFVPVGGKYTMDATEAAEFINAKARNLVVPIHYADGQACDTFLKLLKPEIQTKRFF